MVPCTPSAGFKEQFNFKKTMCLYQSSIKKTEALRNTLHSHIMTITMIKIQVNISTFMAYHT